LQFGELNEHKAEEPLCEAPAAAAAAGSMTMEQDCCFQSLLAKAQRADWHLAANWKWTRRREIVGFANWQSQQHRYRFANHHY